jgi:hypothetical protein
MSTEVSDTDTPTKSRHSNVPTPGPEATAMPIMLRSAPAHAVTHSVAVQPQSASEQVKHQEQLCTKDITQHLTNSLASPLMHMLQRRVSSSRGHLAEETAPRQQNQRSKIARALQCHCRQLRYIRRRIRVGMLSSS